MPLRPASRIGKLGLFSRDWRYVRLLRTIHAAPRYIIQLYTYNSSWRFQFNARKRSERANLCRAAIFNSVEIAMVDEFFPI